MPTEAQVNANRQNAKHSTGPQTARGKARSALNSLKHGLRARVILTHASSVEGEFTSPFAHLLADLVAEYNPVGVVESHCVETIAVATWRLRLVIQTELESSQDPNAALRYEWDLTFDKMNREQDAALLARGITPFAPNPPVIPPEHNCLPPAEKLLPLIRYEAHLERQFYRAFHLLQQLQLARASGTSPIGDGPSPAGGGNNPEDFSSIAPGDPSPGSAPGSPDPTELAPGGRAQDEPSGGPDVPAQPADDFLAPESNPPAPSTSIVASGPIQAAKPDLTGSVLAIEAPRSSNPAPISPVIDRFIGLASVLSPCSSHPGLASQFFSPCCTAAGRLAAEDFASSTSGNVPFPQTQKMPNEPNFSFG